MKKPKRRRKKPFYGWWQYAGHKWPIRAVAMEQGVIRIVASGYVVDDVPGGTCSGAMYGADGAMVFRTPAARYEAMEAGSHGEFTVDFYMERDIRELEDANLQGRDVSVENWFKGVTIAAEVVDQTTARYTWHAVYRLVASGALALLIAGASATAFPSYWFVAPIIAIGAVCGVLYMEHVTTEKGE